MYRSTQFFKDTISACYAEFRILGGRTLILRALTKQGFSFRHYLSFHLSHYSLGDIINTILLSWAMKFIKFNELIDPIDNLNEQKLVQLNHKIMERPKFLESMRHTKL